MEETRLQLQNLTILIGETATSGVLFIRTMLKNSVDHSNRLIHVETLAEARHELAAGGIDIVLLDLELENNDGIKTIEAIKATTMAPLIVLSTSEDENLPRRILQAGAEDYLNKHSVTAQNLHRSIIYAIERNKARIVELERLHLLELREDFMLTLTHDLKNPLIGSNRLLELIAEGSVRVSPEQQSNLLLQIRDSNTKLLAMIQSLYDVYRYEKDLHELHLEKTDLLAVVNHYLRSVRHLMEDKRIVTHVVNNSSETVVLADSLSISRVIQNLIENAIKFSPVEGRVEINLRNEDDQVMINVSDEGPGIEPRDLHKVFMRFYQGRPGRAYNYGMGLGLYLCRQIVEAHSGKIWCSPKEDSGSIFTISLPTSG